MKKKAQFLVPIIAIITTLAIVGCISYKDLISTFIIETIKLPSFDKGTATVKAPLPGCEIYQVGAGVGDITQYPSNQLNGGYVDSSQKTRGIHTRQLARAFVIADKKGSGRVCIITIDDWATSIETREEVVKLLASGTAKDKFGNPINFVDSEGNQLYNINNIMITATHTHTGVMGGAERRMYNIASGGFNEELLGILVQGIVDAIAMAHNNLQDATIEFAKDKLTNEYNVTKNRSITSMLNNPDAPLSAKYTPKSFEEMAKAEIKGKKHVAGEAEKIRKDETAADKTMYLFRFKSYPEGKDIGLINWFAIHGTSISASNPMVSSDNKGVAQQMTEAVMGTTPNPNQDFMAGIYMGQDEFEQNKVSPGFVAGFFQGALGDVDPCRNIYHLDRLGYTLEEDVINVMAAARSQSAKALELYNNPQVAVKGPIASAMQYVSMDNVYVSKKFAYKPEENKAKTHKPASGWAMAAGGEIHMPGFPGGREGMRADESKMPLIGFARSLLVYYRHMDCSQPTVFQSLPQVFVPSREYEENHFPKPILMAGGNANPSWVDTDIPFQIFKIGNYALAALPFETTTYAAYRIKDTIKKELARLGQPVQEVIYAGNTNGYISYMATPQEYELQHYEGASTNFGINQVPACQQEFVRLTTKLVKGQTGRCNYDPGWIVDSPNRVPTNLIVRARPQRNRDRVLAGNSFGMVSKKPEKDVWKWGETFQIEFYSSNMNGNIFHNDSFFYIQRFNPLLNGWVTVTSDNDFNTNLRWNRATPNYSTSTIIWRIPLGTPEGKYRVIFKGSFSRNGKEQQIYSYASDPFSVGADMSKFVSDLFVQVGKQHSIVLKKPVVADQVTLRLKENIGNAITFGEIIINGKTKIPFRNLPADGTAVNLYLPDLEISSLALQCQVTEPETYIPQLEIFHLSNSKVENEVWPGHFTLFCK